MKRIWILLLCTALCITGILIADRSAAATDSRMAGEAFSAAKETRGLYDITFLGADYTLDLRFALPALDGCSAGYRKVGEVLCFLNKPVVDAARGILPVLRETGYAAKSAFLAGILS